MRLVIAEKPSVAQSIAAVLGAKSRHDGYLEGSGYIVSWCFGHLAELAEPPFTMPMMPNGRWRRCPSFLPRSASSSALKSRSSLTFCGS